MSVSHWQARFWGLTASCWLALVLCAWADEPTGPSTGQASEPNQRPTFTSPEAALWQAETLARAGDFLTAAQHLEAAGKTYPQPIWAPRFAYEAARNWRKAGEPRRAAEGLEQAALNWPDSPWCDESLAECIRAWIDAGETEQARAAWNELWCGHPQSAHLSVVCESLAHFLCSVEQFTDADQIIEDLALVSHRTGRLRYYQALSAIARDDHAAALRHLASLSSDERRALGPVVDAALSRVYAATGRHAEARSAALAFLSHAEPGVESDTCQARAIQAAIELRQFDIAMTELQGWRPSTARGSEWCRCAVTLGDRLSETGRHQDALHWYQAALEVEDAALRADACLGAGWSAYRLGEFARASALFARADTGDDARSAGALWMHAVCCDRTGPPATAMAAYEHVVTRFVAGPHASQAMLRLAQLLAADRQLERALGWLERCSAEYPRAPQHDAVLYLQHDVCTRLGHTEAAARTLQSLHDAYPHSTYWPDATYRLAVRAATAGDNARAQQLVDAVLARSPDERLRLHTLQLSGQLAASRGEWKQVADVQQEILASDASDDLRRLAEYWLAESHYRRQDFAAAAEGFERLANTADSPESDWLRDARLRHAQALARQGDWQSAFDAAQQLAERHPDLERQVELDYLLGRCAMSLARFDEARSAFRRAARVTSEPPTELQVMAAWMVGETYLHQRRYVEALGAYQSAARHHRWPLWQAASLLQIGKCHEALQRWEEAAAAYHAVATRHDQSPFAHDAAQRLALIEPQLTSPSSNPSPRTARGSTPASRR